MSITNISPNKFNNEIISNFDKIAGKLTLFPDTINKNKQNQVDDSEILERPVTPLEREIQDAPNSLHEFLYLLQRRIPLFKDISLSEEEQLSLLGIVESEITLLWPALKNLVDYPLFNDAQNKELRSTIFIVIITKCQTLFKEYIDKIYLYNNRDIFSDESNLVRVKLQLAEDIRHKLHIPTLRRQIYQNITQDIHIDIPKCCEEPSLEKEEKKLQYSLYEKSSRISEMISESPENIAKVENKNEINQITIETIVTTTNVTNISNAQIPLNKNTELTSMIVDNSTSHKKINKDLSDLMNEESSDDEKESFPNISHINPALEKTKSRNANLNQKIEILKKQNDDQDERSKFIFRQPLVQQPSTIQKSYNNKIYYVPDIRPTERKSNHEINLTLFSPVWNELADEITPEIVTQLDSNLFRGAEVKDIYNQMMKTVSRDYLSYTDDPTIEDCPNKVYIQEIKASHTLQSEFRKERIINNDLKKFNISPWKLNSKTRADWEQPSYTLENSSSTELDLKQYVQLSKDELSNKINFARGSYGDSLSSAVYSTRDISTSIAYINDAPAIGRDTPIRNIIPTRAYILPLEKFELGISRLPKLMQDRLLKQYKEWQAAWKNNFDTQDYMKYLSLQSSDFLSVTFHDYDSMDEVDLDEDDDDLYPERVEEKHKMTEREAERYSILENKVQELQDEKDYYEKGYWNPSIIRIGGLGKIPTLTNNEKKGLLSDKPSLPDPNERHSKMSAYSRAQSSISPGKPTPLFVRKRNTIRPSETSEDHFLLGDAEQRLSIIQNRLEKIWDKLKMPNHLRLDMAIKYSSDINIKTVEIILKKWDLATNAILERETLISELEKFERVASNPNRFFAKGYQGSSLARIEESKIRQEFNEKIDQCSIIVREAIQDVKDSCSDELSYEGRLYHDKMLWDRTEMLYWLQQERKERSLNGMMDVLLTN